MRSSYVQRKQHTEKTSQLKNIIPSVKRGGGSIMAWVSSCLLSGKSDDVLGHIYAEI